MSSSYSSKGVQCDKCLRIITNENKGQDDIRCKECEKRELDYIYSKCPNKKEHELNWARWKFYNEAVRDLEDTIMIFTSHSYQDFDLINKVRLLKKECDIKEAEVKNDMKKLSDIEVDRIRSEYEKTLKK
jgi:hypothetical protein